MKQPLRLVLGISGASGMPLAQALLDALLRLGAETHVIVSATAARVIETECPPLTGLLDQAVRHDPADFFAPPASGSWRHQGMIICPCTMSTLAHVAAGTNANLMHRAAEVTLKECRPLVLVTRETPLSLVHLRNMTAAREAGAVIFPPVPAFYQRPRDLNEMLRHTAGRILDQLRLERLGLEHDLCRRWGESHTDDNNV